MYHKTIDNEIMIRYFSGKATAEEQQQLLSWVNESPDNELLLFTLKDIYEASTSVNLPVEAQTEVCWRQMKETIDRAKPQNKIHPRQSKRKSWVNQIWKYVAIFIFGTLLGSLVVNFISSHSDNIIPTIVAKQFEIQTEKGERATIHLPDGSKVVLNACSYISYPSDFGENTRELTLTGEGYFDVQTNPDMPFIVKTSGLNIKAFGTVFNVRAYLDEDAVETTLVRGDVSIETQTNKHIVSLKPAQVITIPKDLIRTNHETEYSSRTATQENDIKQSETIHSEKLQTKEAVLIDKINPEVYTSWKDNKWIIESESLESLATKIERKYDVVISIEGKTIKNYVFSGTLKNLPLEQVLETIRLNAPIQYTIIEKNVLISEDKQLIKKFENILNH